VALVTSRPAKVGTPVGPVFEQDLVVESPEYTGTNNRSRAREIGDREAAELLNVDLEDPTTPKRRDGYREVQAKQSGFVTTNLRGCLLADFDDGPYSRLMVAGFNGGRTYHTHSPASNGWKEALVTSEISGTVSRSYFPNDERAKGVQGNGLLYIVAPNSGSTMHVMRADGTLLDAGGLNESPPADAVDGVYMLSRMWFLAGSTLYWSKLLPEAGDLLPTPAAFDRDNSTAGGGGSLNLSPERTGIPVAVLPWRNESLICFFKNQIEEVIIDSANPINSVRRRVEGRFGCGARDSIVQIGDEVFFLDQFGSYRALRRNQLGTMQGVVPEPISDRFRGELPNNLNMKHAWKTQAELLGEFLYVLYPQGTSTDPNAAMVIDLGRQTIYGPWVFARPMSRLMVSDIEGGAPRLYGLDGHTASPQSRVYRFFDGFYSDNGTAIKYQETSKAYDFNGPWVDKIPEWYDMEFTGDVGAVPVLSVRTSENDDFVPVGAKAVELSTASSFPLVAGDDFPIAAADFPLVGGVIKNTSMKGEIHETYTGNLPLYDSDLPLTDEDLPLYGAGGTTPGRVIQWRVEESTDAVAFERHSVRIGYRVQNFELDNEP
jgi:hypothetical protein